MRNNPPPGMDIIRRKLGERLLSLRDQSRLTQEQAARLLERSRPTLWKLEKGRSEVTIRLRDIAAMCDLYGASAQETAILLGLATATDAKVWVTSLTQLLPAGYDLAADLENHAASISLYADRLIPNLLQTERYARAVLEHTGAHHDDIDWQVADRMARRRLLTRRHPPNLDVVIAEHALRQVVGDGKVMAGQYPPLLAVSELPTVHLRVLPVDAGFHHGLTTGPFSVLRFRDGGGSPVVHCGGERPAIWDRPADVDQFDVAFADIARRALDVEQSCERIRVIAAEVAAEGGRPVVHP